MVITELEPRLFNLSDEDGNPDENEPSFLPKEDSGPSADPSETAGDEEGFGSDGNIEAPGENEL